MKNVFFWFCIFTIYAYVVWRHVHLLYLGLTHFDWLKYGDCHAYFSVRLVGFIFSNMLDASPTYLDIFIYWLINLWLFLDARSEIHRESNCNVTKVKSYLLTNYAKQKNITIFFNKIDRGKQNKTDPICL